MGLLVGGFAFGLDEGDDVDDGLEYLQDGLLWIGRCGVGKLVAGGFLEGWVLLRVDRLVRLQFVVGDRLVFEILGCKNLFIVLEKVNKLSEQCNNKYAGVFDLCQCKKVREYLCDNKMNILISN